ncbi:MAG: hypothetical protein QOE35_1758 [Actinomycetota bacterium]|jgi:hypothetical protein
MLERLPDNVRTPAVARAVVSPSALLLAGAGTAAAILGGLPIAAAAGIGALAWAVRVAAAVPRRPKGERVDAFRVGEPWRKYVLDAQQAKATFERTTRRMKDGPLRERLEGIGSRLDDGVTECWHIARQGDDLVGAYRQLDVRNTAQELAGLEAEARANSDRDRKSSLDRAIAAVQAQLASAERIKNVAENASDRLKVINAQLDEAVARAVELSVRANDVSELSPLTTDVDNLVSELESLRQGLEETGDAAGGMTA